MYTACVLEESSRNELLGRFMLPANFDILAHHMTVDMKPVSKSMAAEMHRQRCEMKVIRFGRLDGIIAVEVETVVPSKNARKHITLCVDRANGWKPVQSNDIIDWIDVVETFPIFGIVKEVA